MGEATFLNTGYGVYGKELLTRLHQTGKYDIAELGGYGKCNDAHSLDIPWTYYGCMPDDETQNAEYSKEIANQWGMWRFEEICLDFQPDVVLDIRDIWMSDFVGRSPYRRLFSWILMPTIDSAPQMEQWLDTYINADAVLTYSEFGRDMLLKETGGQIEFMGIASPAADYTLFKPVSNKQAHKSSMGLDEDTLIVGTVMRNQKRKLYPDLISGFKSYLEQHTRLADKTFLYIHTGYPDIGWDLPRLIRESGIGHKILCTYMCVSCHNVFPSFFQDARRTCPKCGAPHAKMPSGTMGVTTANLADIMNTFDVYVQYSTCEGFGMPQIEAAACGVPIMSVDYSAMSSVVKNLGGTPIKVQRLFREAETHAYRAYPDNKDFANKLGKILSKSNAERKKIARDTYLACRKHYDWERATNIWINALDIVQPSDWNVPPRLTQPNLNIPQGMSDQSFVNWCIANIWGEPDKINSYFALRMARDLHYGEAISGYGGVYYSEDSLLIDKPKYRTFNRGDVIEAMIELNKHRNYWEQRRAGILDVETPMYIQLARHRRST